MSVATTAISKTCPDCKKTYPWQEQHVCEAKPVAAGAGADDPLVGAVLGERYRIDSFLSSGGMGVVYKGRHVVLDKPVAVKLLRESQDPVAQQRFLLEAKSACHIGHEHIVDINDFGVLEDGRPYLVMEFLQGQSLETLLQKQGSLPWGRVCRIGEQIARGLQAVHEKGIMHRDLKPGNIFLLDRAKRDFVKILDFGIAKVMAGTRETLSDGGKPLVANMRQTTQGTVLGTPEYLSPEQAAGESIDARVDIYALGCILYEMLTGSVPFRGNGPMSTLMKHLTEKVVPPRKRRTDLTIPESLEKIVLKAMAREKTDRYATMEELATALQGEIESSITSQGDQSTPSIQLPITVGGENKADGALAYAPTTAAAVVSRPATSRQNLIRGGLVAASALALIIVLFALYTLRASNRQPVADPSKVTATGQGPETPPPPDPKEPPPKPNPDEMAEDGKKMGVSKPAKGEDKKGKGSDDKRASSKGKNKGKKGSAQVTF
jgi:serine/threonine-protein kinase